MKRFLDWLIDNWLSDWLVSREDYADVQRRRGAAEDYVRRLLDELDQSYSDLYSRAFRPIEEYGDNIKAEFVSVPRVDLRELEFGYRFRIPERTFYTLKDPTSYFYETKQVVIAKLVNHFEKHMQQNLFSGLQRNPS